jgi:hypothetical protein
VTETNHETPKKPTADERRLTQMKNGPRMDTNVREGVGGNWR